jgi:hypothetical protein
VILPPRDLSIGQFVVQITPLLNNDQDDIPESALLTPIQFSDLTVTHPLNDSRTASVTLSMYDPVVETLEPFQQALRILYFRPGDPGYEVVFWGQANVSENYGDATITLEAQDPGGRMQHHYVRIGDEAMNDPDNPMKGTITTDFEGLRSLVLAAQVPSGPQVGVWISDWWGSTRHPTMKMGIDRGQEVWALILQIVQSELGPDIDMWPAPGLDWGLYATMETHDEMMTDVSSTVQFVYGYAGDNVADITVTPSHPTTMATVIDNEQNWRVLVRAPDQVQDTGYWIDWITVDHEVKKDNTDVLVETGKAHVRAYARPPKQVEVTLRPDTGQDFYYGYPYAYNSDDPGDFYVGDLVRLKAKRGERSFSQKFRIMQVELSQEGSRSLVQTKLTIVPRPGPVTIIANPVVNTDYPD